MVGVWSQTNEATEGLGPKHSSGFFATADGVSLFFVVVPAGHNVIDIMSDEHCEEQEMEAEALTAIFDDCLEIVSSTQPFEWAISLWPEQHGDATENHVGIRVRATIPLDYPELSPPRLTVEVLKGLTDEHAEELLALANAEAEASAGMPAMYAICERLREWLLENNVKGMDDLSMYAQMMKREKEKEREGVRSSPKHVQFVVVMTVVRYVPLLCWCCWHPCWLVVAVAFPEKASRTTTSRIRRGTSDHNPLGRKIQPLDDCLQ